MIIPNTRPNIPSTNTPKPVSADTAFVKTLAMSKIIPITIATTESADSPMPIHKPVLLPSPP